MVDDADADAVNMARPTCARDELESIGITEIVVSVVIQRKV